ncbi:MAG: winged helix-turn-helix transcriptional regulator [Thermoplasmatota archaeon]
MHRLLALTAFLLLLAAPAHAQDAVDDTAQAVNRTADEAGNATSGLLESLKGVAEGIGDAATATGEGISKGASAVGSGLAAVVRFVGTAAVATVAGIAQMGSVVSTGLGDAVLGSIDGLGSAGVLAASGIAIIGSGIAWAATFAFEGLLSGILAYAGLVGSMRPEAMPMAAFATVTAAGAAGSAGAGGWAGMQALKKWGLIGSGLGGVAGFSRIDDADLLEHPLRGQIFDTIKGNPGIHASQLARELDVGWGTITHHLDKLQKGKLVTTRKVNNQKCFFEQGGMVSRQDMAIASALKGDTAAGIAEFVGTHPMTSQKQMAEALDISPALASFHVKKLVNLGVLEKFRHGKETLLTTSDGLRRVMASADPHAAAAMQADEEGFEYSS